MEGGGREAGGSLGYGLGFKRVSIFSKCQVPSSYGFVIKDVLNILIGLVTF